MGRSIPSDANLHGRNAEYVKLDDRRYVRCTRCGFICHLDRDTRMEDGSRGGWGIDYVDQDICETAYNEATLNYNGNDKTTTFYNEAVAYNTLYTYDGNDTTLRYDGVTRTISDPQVSGGCPQCGTYLYNK